GVTSIGFFEFMVATGVGQLPATVVYSILGENLTGGVKVGLLAFGAVAALFVLGFAVKARLDRKIAAGRGPAAS
ncbi:MAG: TVP38/TMEM64 family protein, partial [Dehalococcoidia bacterium]|nr:TVP38/TMEM64 family protein [Dehalococcoidia bacterium]